MRAHREAKAAARAAWLMLVRMLNAQDRLLNESVRRGVDPETGEVLPPPGTPISRLVRDCGLSHADWQGRMAQLRETLDLCGRAVDHAEAALHELDDECACKEA